MKDIETRGKELRSQAKEIVLDFMNAAPDCGSNGDGMRQASIFRACNFDWGDYPNARSTNQQYWLVALLRELEAEGKVERVGISGPWRLL